MLGIPELTEVRAWCGVTVSSVTDEQLESIRQAELATQARLLRIPDDSAAAGSAFDPGFGSGFGNTDAEATYPPPLRIALLRRCQRAVAAKQLPLGMVGDSAGEYGASYLKSWDPEINRLENPYRIPVVA